MKNKKLIIFAFCVFFIAYLLIGCSSFFKLQPKDAELLLKDNSKVEYTVEVIENGCEFSWYKAEHRYDEDKNYTQLLDTNDYDSWCSISGATTKKLIITCVNSEKIGDLTFDDNIHIYYIRCIVKDKKGLKHTSKTVKLEIIKNK